MRTPVSLLQRVKSQSDPLAWPQFVDVMLPLMSQWVGRLNLSRDDAADLIQDVFLVLFQKLPTFQYDPAQSFRAWLWTVLKNRATDQARRNQPQRLDSQHEVPVVDVPLIEEAEYRRALIAQILTLVRSEMPEKMWRAFEEHCLNGRGADEVAAELVISPGSVYVAKGRALKLVRERLENLLDD